MRGRSFYKPTFQILWESVPIWKKLSHPGIATFRGVDTELFQLALVYDWDSEENDNVMQYVESRPQANRLILVRTSLRRIILVISLPGYSCWKSRTLCNTFILSTFPTGVSPG